MSLAGALNFKYISKFIGLSFNYSAVSTYPYYKPFFLANQPLYFASSSSKRTRNLSQDKGIKRNFKNLLGHDKFSEKIFGNKIGGIANREARIYEETNKLDEALWRDIRTEIYLYMSVLQPRCIALVLNSLSRINLKDESLFLHVGNSLNAAWLRNLNIQDLAIVLNAYAKFKIKNMRIMQLFSEELLWKIPDGKIQELALIANAYAKLNIYVFQLFVHLAEELKRRLVVLKKLLPKEEKHLDFDQSSIGNRLYEKHDDCKIKFPVFYLHYTPQNVANILHAFGKLRHHDKELFELLYAIASSCVDKTNDIDIMNVVYALGIIRCSERIVYQKIVSSLVRRISHLQNSISDNQTAFIIQNFSKFGLIYGHGNHEFLLCEKLLVKFSNGNLNDMSLKCIQLLLNSLHYILILKIDENSHEVPVRTTLREILNELEGHHESNQTITSRTTKKTKPCINNHIVNLGLCSDLFFSIVCDCELRKNFTEKDVYLLWKTLFLVKTLLKQKEYIENDSKFGLQMPKLFIGVLKLTSKPILKKLKREQLIRLQNISNYLSTCLIEPINESGDYLILKRCISELMGA